MSCLNARNRGIKFFQSQLAQVQDKLDLKIFTSDELEESKFNPSLIPFHQTCSKNTILIRLQPFNSLSFFAIRTFTNFEKPLFICFGSGFSREAGNHIDMFGKW